MLSDDHLIYGDPQQVADFLGVSTRTLRRYAADPSNMPEGVKKLLRMRAEGDLAALGGKAWEGFYLQPAGLFCPMWQRNISPETIKGWFFELQELAALRVEVKKARALELEVKNLRDALAARSEPVPLRLVK